MKQLAAALLILIFQSSLNAQELNFSLNPDFQRAIKLERLKNAKSLSDILDHYPHKWIEAYAFVKITSSTNGNQSEALGTSEVLNKKQIEILQSAVIDSEIVIDVEYKTRNTVTNNLETRYMNVILTVVPKMEASFVGGESKLREYLSKNCIEKLLADVPVGNQHGKLIFTIDEKGRAIDVIIIDPSDNEVSDDILVNAIKKMPPWIPAQSDSGLKVKQNFVFDVGTGGC